MHTHITRAVSLSTSLQFCCRFLGGITAAAQAILRFSVAWSVVCRLSHLWTLLKPFDGFRCHLAGTLVRSNDPQWKERFGCQTSSQSMEWNCCCRLANKNVEWFLFFPNYLLLLWMRREWGGSVLELPDPAVLIHDQWEETERADARCRYQLHRD